MRRFKAQKRTRTFTSVQQVFFVALHFHMQRSNRYVTAVVVLLLVVVSMTDPQKMPEQKYMNTYKFDDDVYLMTKYSKPYLQHHFKNKKLIYPHAELKCLGIVNINHYVQLCGHPQMVAGISCSYTKSRQRNIAQENLTLRNFRTKFYLPIRKIGAVALAQFGDFGVALRSFISVLFLFTSICPVFVYFVFILLQNLYMIKQYLKDI